MWTEDQIAYLHERVRYDSDEEIAAELKKSTACVRKYRQRLGIKKNHGRGVKEVVDDGTLLEDFPAEATDGTV